MLLQNASVHHYAHTSIERSLGRGLLDHILLKPHAARSNPDRLIDVPTRLITPSEDVDEIDLLRHFFEARISPFPEHLRFVWIDWDDAIPVRLHVTRHAVACAAGV